MQKRKLTRKCSYLNVASGTSQWARYQEASLDVEELVLQLLSSPGCQQDHCLNLSLSICSHHLHHQLVGLQLVITCALPAMVSVPFSTPPSLCQFCVSSSFRYFHFYVKKNGLILATGQWNAPSAVINDAWYCMVLHSIAWYCMLLHGITWHCMVLHGIALY